MGDTSLNNRKVKYLHRLLPALFLGLGSGLVPAAVHADDETVQVAPTELVSAKMREISREGGGVGVHWDLVRPDLPSSYVAYRTHNPMKGQKATADSVLCSGFTDGNCAPVGDATIETTSVLGRCTNELDVGCIERLRMDLGGTGLVDLSFLGYATGTTEFSESSTLNLPRGSSVSTWGATDGTRYLLIASMMSNLVAESGSWSISSQSLNLGVYRLSRTAEVRVNPAQLISVPSQSAYKIVGNPNQWPTLIEFKPATRIELSVRIPNQVSGWFNGRLANGSVGTTLLPNNRTSYVLTGEVARTYIAGGALNPNTTTGFPGKISPVPNWGSAFGHSVGMSNSTAMYEQWAPFLGDRTLVTQTRWNLSATTWARNGCFSSGTGMSALLATNAAIYDGSPPTWNDTTKSLSFQVTSPHFDENGTEAVGNYTLAIPSGSVKCLYGRDSLPKYFQVLVDYTGSGEDFKVISALSENNGWVSFSASGFHFSNPVISLRFGENASSFADQQLDVYTSNKSADSPTSGSATTSASNYVRISAAGAKATIKVQLVKKMTIKIYRKVGSKTTLIKTLAGRVGTNTFVTAYRKTYSFIVRDSRGNAIPRQLGSASFRLGGLTIR